MNEKELLDLEDRVRNTGLSVTGYRRIGLEFLEMHVRLKSGIDFKKAVADLRALGFYEIRIDGEDPESIDLTHACY